MLPGTGKMDYRTGSQDAPEASLGLHDASSGVDGVRVERAIFWFFTKSHSLRKQLSLNPDVFCKLSHQAFLSSLSVTEPTGCYTVVTVDQELCSFVYEEGPQNTEVAEPA